MLHIAGKTRDSTHVAVYDQRRHVKNTQRTLREHNTSQGRSPARRGEVGCDLRGDTPAHCVRARSNRTDVSLTPTKTDAIPETSNRQTENR